MTDKAKKILDEYKDPKKAFYVELLQIKTQVKGYKKSSGDAVLALLNYLEEDYKDLVLNERT